MDIVENALTLYRICLTLSAIWRDISAVFFSRLSHPLLSPDVVSITKAAAITARIDITVTGTKYKRILVLIFCLGFLFFFTGTLLHNLYKFFTSIAQ